MQRQKTPKKAPARARHVEAHVLQVEELNQGSDGSIWTNGNETLFCRSARRYRRCIFDRGTPQIRSTRTMSVASSPIPVVKYILGTSETTSLRGPAVHANSPQCFLSQRPQQLQRVLCDERHGEARVETPMIGQSDMSTSMREMCCGK